MARSLPFSLRRSKHNTSKAECSRRQGVRLNLEALEDRTLPAVSIPQLFVADVFVTEFARSAAPTEIINNGNELLPGFTSADLASLILSSPSFQAVEVRQLYVKFAGFDPGNGGVSFWLDLLTQPGNTMDTVRVNFLSSDIYFNRVGGNNTAFVSALFGDVWSKPVDVGLLNQFVAALNNGASRSSIAKAFVTDARGYQAQIVADYNKVLAHDPDPASLNFFSGYRMQGGTNEAILALLHGSSELMKHLEFFQSKTSLTDPNIAALTFRAGLKTQIQAEQGAEATAVNAAKQAQMDATSAAADQTDSAQQLTIAKGNLNNPTAAQTAADAAQADANDAQAKDNDAKAQVITAQTALASAEPTPATVQAVKDAQAAETAAAQSATQAQKDADDAQMAANAAASSGDWITQLTNLKTLADGADTAAQGFVPQANTAANTAQTDATMAQGLATAAFNAVNAVNPMPPYTPGSQAAQLIDAATASAQAAQTAASAAAGFANNADTARQTVIARANDAHTAAMMVDMKVNDALSILNGGFGLGGFFFDFTLIFQFLDDFATAFAEKAIALQAKADAQTALSSVQSNLTSAAAQLGLAQVAKTQTDNDIAQAAAAQAANNGGSGTGNDHDGDDNSHKRPGGGHQG